MRRLGVSTCAVVVCLGLACGCGSGEKNAEQPPTDRAPEPAIPDDDIHRNLPPPEADDPSAMQGRSGHQMGLNTEITIDDSIRDGWSGVRIRVVEIQGGRSQVHDVPFDTPTVLGESGLTLTASAFVPDFVMDPGGITSRSPEPNNPAARVVITGEGDQPFEGWLFAAVPEIHAFPHDRYKVLLDEGIRAK